VTDFRFVFMLTRHDRTVADASLHLQTALALGVRDIGFKDIGLGLDQLAALNRAIQAAGGTRVDDVLPILAGTSIRYFPFPGRICGHPSVLEGTIEEIVHSARELAARDGVHGLDLLAYRSKQDAPALMNAVCAAVPKPVLVAGRARRQVPGRGPGTGNPTRSDHPRHRDACAAPSDNLALRSGYRHAAVIAQHRVIAHPASPR
jgi:hypothetical protein